MLKSNADFNTAEMFPVCQARPADADAIYHLIRDSFGENYLGFTIYQAPESLHYLRDLIADGPEKSGHAIYVLRNENRISGYYDAALLGREHFLNYIAVAGEYRGCGAGGRLLDHFENAGITSGCKKLGLDLFGSNLKAQDWYNKRGYRLEKTSYVAQIQLKRISGGRADLHFGIDEFDCAISQEKRLGFSKLECKSDSARIMVGFINRTICKILHYEGIELESAIEAVANRFSNEREILIVSSTADIPSSWQHLAAEKVLRLSKII
jgi:ribosomal protein S18 acetylase RimI-like enzyme